MFREEIDYKKFIGKKVSVKTSYLRYCVVGVLSNVYCDVLIIQGLTCWGFWDKDITEFEVIHEQCCLGFVERL